ncbi:MAG: hypothetical protein JSS89_00120 [Bacteroidetes bacterium]|nr:hypothetical protein [Bacteroidota bacterium]
MNTRPVLRKVLRYGAYVVASLALLVVLVMVAAYLLLNDTVQGKVQRAVTTYLQERADAQVRQIGAKNSVQIGAITYSFFTNRLEIRDVHVYIADSSSTGGQVLDAGLSHITCTGLTWLDVMFGDGLALGDIEISHPRLERRYWTSKHDTTPQAIDTSAFQLPKIPNVDTLIQRALIESLPTYVRPLTINAVRVIGAEFINSQRSPADTFAGATRDLNITVHDIRAGVEGARPLGSVDVSIATMERAYANGKRSLIVRPRMRISDRDSAVQVDTILLIDPLGLTIRAHQVTFSYRDRAIRIDSFAIAASGSDAAYFKRNGRSDRIAASGRSVLLDGIDLNAASNGTALHVRACSIGSVSLDVLSNMRPPAPRSTGKRTPQLNDLARRIPFSLKIDTIVVPSATINYGEYHANSATPGRLWWDNIAFRAVGVDPKGTMTVSASGRFMGTSRMKAQFIFPLSSPTYSLDATGSLAAIDPTILNGFVTISDNMRIKGGKVQEASFGFTVRGLVARGWLKASYTGLGVELLNAKTKKAGFLNSIVSWVANTFVVRTENLPTDSDYKTGVIKYTLPADAAVMQTIWFPVRAGLGDLVGF